MQCQRGNGCLDPPSLLGTYNNSAHTGLSNPSSTKDVRGIVRDLMSTPCGEGLEKADRTTEVLGLILVRHMAHLIGDLL